jgi:hypothetical protein
MATLQELIDKYRITIEVKEGAPAEEGFEGAVGYIVTLRRGLGHSAEDPENDIAPVWASRDGMTLAFYMGPALGREPTAYDVLSCLLLDAASYDNARDFETWAEEYGYDPDSRKAERIYEKVGEQRDALIDFLSDSSTVKRVSMGPNGFAEVLGGEHYDEFLESDHG